MNNKIEEFILGNKENIIRDLAELVAVPSVMGEPGEGVPFGTEPRRALDTMRRICEKMGFKTTVYGDAVLCADYLPDGCDMAELGILAHLDVVPVERDNWDTDPFELVEKDGVLYGRGTIDDKGPAVAALWALYCVKELGIPLKSGVRLIFGTDEENGSEDLEIYKEYDGFPCRVFTPDGSFPVINAEKGMMRSVFSAELGGEGSVVSFEGGRIPNAVPDKARAVLADISAERVRAAIADDRSGAVFELSDDHDGVSIVCKGRAAHASTPENGINAVTALIALINRLFDSGCLPICDGMQRDVLRGLEKIFPFGETDGASCGMKCADEIGALTCVFSIFKMDMDCCEATIDSRFPSCLGRYDMEEKESAAMINAGMTLSGYMCDEAHIVSEDDEFVKTLLEVYEESEGERGHCIAIGGGTYVHNIEGGVAFGAERGDTDYHMHGDNEFITADELLKDAALFAKAIVRICG
ncbi:MAG: Sapep family Mn(2+)-dependent dipeptidase [Oscillospiraceae bacterium]|nr:Sapep family Mn(2+)-dependent dipeptidase [Oscillospiraceae bacterium]